MDQLQIAVGAEEKYKKIRKTLASVFKETADNPEMRRAFAAQLAVPILMTINPQSSVRHIFMTDEVPPGALARYPKDFADIPAVMLPQLGAVPENRVSGDELLIDTWKIATSTQYGIPYARDARFSVAEEAMRKIANAIIRQEEQSGWAVIQAAVLSGNTITDSSGVISVNNLTDMYVTMEQQGYVSTDIYMSPRRFADIRTWTYTQIDPFTQRQAFEQGGLGTLWGANIHVLRHLSDTEVYLFDINRFGIMPIREELQTYDDPVSVRELNIGIIAWEEVGFAAVDPRAVVMLSL